MVAVSHSLGDFDSLPYFKGIHNRNNGGGGSDSIKGFESLADALLASNPESVTLRTLQGILKDAGKVTKGSVPGRDIRRTLQAARLVSHAFANSWHVAQQTIAYM